MANLKGALKKRHQGRMKKINKIVKAGRKDLARNRTGHRSGHK